MRKPNSPDLAWLTVEREDVLEETGDALPQADRDPGSQSSTQLVSLREVQRLSSGGRCSRVRFRQIVVQLQTGGNVVCNIIIKSSFSYILFYYIRKVRHRLSSNQSTNKI